MPRLNTLDFPVSEPRPLGSFLRTDQDGYLQNDCDRSRIAPDLIALVTQFYQQCYGPQLVAVYVRGSVARGVAVAGVSDLDTFAVVEDGAASCPLLPATLLEQLRAAAPGLVDFEFHACSRNAVIGNYYSPWAFLVQTQSVCIFGTDLASQLAPYRVGPELMAEALYLSQRLVLYRERLRNEHEMQQRIVTCQWFMKSLVRAAFDLTLDRCGRYTRDLYPCYSTFAALYPQQAPQCMRALRWAIAPDDAVDAHLALAEEFGQWIVAETAYLIHKHKLDLSKYAL